MRVLCLVLAVWTVPAGADWRFESPMPVTGAAQRGVFHHLDTAGRRSLALSAQTVGLVWEDNRTGAPRVYAAFVAPDGAGVTRALQISGGAEAYAPVITGLGDGQFLAAWEEDARVWVRRVGPAGLGAPQPLDSQPGSQPTLVTRPDGSVVAAWARREGRLRRIVVAPVRLTDDGLALGSAQPVDSKPPVDQQLYPALAAAVSGLVVAWEDRRHGHTRIYFSHAPAGLAFGPLQQLNELLPPRSARYGRGTGVTRVALDAHGARVAGTWMDKRHFKGGYDVYAAVSDDGGRHFGSNEKAQDMFGEHIPQWHPDVAVGPAGQVVVAWDDPRDDSADIWMAWRQGPGQWSDDQAVPGASGPGDQTHPVVEFDAGGRLHLVWVARKADGAGTRVWYTTARFVDE